MKRHLLAAELGLELAEPVAELLHMAVEEHGQLQHVPPAFHTPGEGGDVGLQLPGNTDCGDDDQYGDGDDNQVCDWDQDGICDGDDDQDGDCEDGAPVDVISITLPSLGELLGSGQQLLGVGVGVLGRRRALGMLVDTAFSSSSTT